MTQLYQLRIRPGECAVARELPVCRRGVLCVQPLSAGRVPGPLVQGRVKTPLNYSLFTGAELGFTASRTTRGAFSGPKARERRAPVWDAANKR